MFDLFIHFQLLDANLRVVLVKYAIQSRVLSLTISISSRTIPNDSALSSSVEKMTRMRTRVSKPTSHNARFNYTVDFFRRLHIQESPYPQESRGENERTRQAPISGVCTAKNRAIHFSSEWIRKRSLRT